MQEIFIKEINTTSPEYPQLLEFRHQLLRAPLGLNLFEEDLGDDQQDFILLVMQDKEVIGCVMLHPLEDGRIKLRQMAIAERFQGKGIGKILVEDAEQTAFEHDCTEIILHARRTAEGFYNKLGYKASGEEFTEVGIPHIAMRKQL
ncbi:MAG TPA: GNAT family N-acetyltransferase [Flavipsychrobacter sp.]|jgi:predicted GNAT family N-acyltransferase|nr:GNAT family N-acetyltransferase [Flavipsychrobacter sp.]